MDNSSKTTPLTLDDLIAFGLDYLEALKDRSGIGLTRLYWSSSSSRLSC